MNKRVHEIAKERGLPAKQVLERLQAAGIDVKAPSSSVDEDVAARALGNGGARPSTPSPAPAQPRPLPAGTRRVKISDDDGPRGRRSAPARPSAAKTPEPVRPTVAAPAPRGQGARLRGRTPRHRLGPRPPRRAAPRPPQARAARTSAPPATAFRASVRPEAPADAGGS